MRAYALAKGEKSKVYSLNYQKISKIKGVVKVDSVFGPWDYVITIEGDGLKGISKVRDEIISIGSIRDVLTEIVYHTKER